MAEPSTLAQMAINMANMDFVRRVTPHPQVASPLQQLITEEQQAKGDPGDDEIKGLDTKVLLNADTLEDGEPVTLDFEGQVETPSSHPPPLRNSHTPHTLQQSPPVSAQLSTSAIDPVQQLVQALLTIGQNMAMPPPQPSHNQPIPCLSPRHIRWLQPQGPASILTAVPNHLQLIPATVLNGCHQSLFHHQLFEEDGIRMVQARCIGRQP